MPFRSLRSKLVVIFVLVLSLLALASGFATLNTMKRDSQTQAREILTVANKVLRQALDIRAEQLSDSVRLLAADFAFRRAVATAEQETIESVLQNHGSRINASLMLLLSPEGELLVSSDMALTMADIMPLFRQTNGNSNSTVADIVSLDGQPYQLVLAPVKAPALIAWVGMGFPLDSPLAENIKSITALDISFVTRHHSGVQLKSSTLDQAHQQLLPTLVPQLIQQADTAIINAEQDYISVALPLDKLQQLWAIQHLPNLRWLASYQQFRQQLLLIFSAALAVALLVAIVFARSITKPLNVLSQFASRIGQGQADTAPTISGNDEVAVLSRTLSTMQHDIRQREQQLLFNAEHDSLTGCYNRTAAERLLQPWLSLQDGCLIQLNIQQFKNINDVLGFSNGDQLLQQLAQRLNQLSPAAELIARLGADEFVLLYSQNKTAGQVQQLLRQLLDGFLLQKSVINLKLRAGVFNFSAGYVSVNDALRRVNIALDNARKVPENIAFYQQGQDESHQRELTLIHDLPLALQNGQFYVVYQPKVDIKQQQCYSAEALIRWQHPQLGFIAPDQFIALAEHAGCIGLITNWMLRQVINQTAQWWQQGIQVQIAVNLSVFDLLNPALTDTIRQLLQQQLPAAALALEVTESAIMHDADSVILQLSQLRALGISLAVDDFGTGQSSLAYLKQLPVHEVKIDRAFVKDIEHNANDALIVSATTQLAHSLGFSVTAEGLENGAGLARLLDSGCDKVQGYYFAKPLQAPQFSQWLAQFNADTRPWFNTETIA